MSLASRSRYDLNLNLFMSSSTDDGQSSNSNSSFRPKFALATVRSFSTLSDGTDSTSPRSSVSLCSSSNGTACTPSSSSESLPDELLPRTPPQSFERLGREAYEPWKPWAPLSLKRKSIVPHYTELESLNSRTTPPPPHHHHQGTRHAQAASYSYGRRHTSFRPLPKLPAPQIETPPRGSYDSNVSRPLPQRQVHVQPQPQPQPHSPPPPYSTHTHTHPHPVPSERKSTSIRPLPRPPSTLTIFPNRSSPSTAFPPTRSSCTTPEPWQSAEGGYFAGEDVIDWEAVEERMVFAASEEGWEELC